MVAAADGSLTGQTPGGDTLRVREVWQDTVEEEMRVGGWVPHPLAAVLPLLAGTAAYPGDSSACVASARPRRRRPPSA